MTEEQRLRSALVDIAAGGGWQGRFAQEVLDGAPEVLPCDGSSPAINLAFQGTVNDMTAFVRRFREEARRQGVRLDRLGGLG